MRVSEGGGSEGKGAGRAGVEVEGATGNTRSWCRVAETLFRRFRREGARARSTKLARKFEGGPSKEACNKRERKRERRREMWLVGDVWRRRRRMKRSGRRKIFSSSVAD